MAVAWNHIQIELIDRLGDDGLALARQLAMTTYRSEADFEERFGRDASPTDGSRSSAISTTRAASSSSASTGDVPRSWPGRWTATTSGRAGRPQAALGPLAAVGHAADGVGIEDDILYGPRQVRCSWTPRPRPVCEAEYRELRSNKGHDAFLVEWDQLGHLLRGALAGKRSEGG